MKWIVLPILINTHIIQVDKNGKEIYPNMQVGKLYIKNTEVKKIVDEEKFLKKETPNDLVTYRGCLFYYGDKQTEDKAYYEGSCEELIIDLNKKED